MIRDLFMFYFGDTSYYHAAIIYMLTYYPITCFAFIVLFWIDVGIILYIKSTSYDACELKLLFKLFMFYMVLVLMLTCTIWLTEEYWKYIPQHLGA